MCVNSCIVIFFLFSGFLLLIVGLCCFLKSNLHILIITSYAVEIGQEKILSYYYAHFVQINQCGKFRLSINGGVRFAILFS